MWIDANWLEIPSDENDYDELIRLADQVASAPTLDLVRCKECRYKDMDICSMYRLVVAGVRKDDDFCSYGERSE